MTNEPQSEYVTKFLEEIKQDGQRITPLVVEAAQYFERREDPDQVISDKEVFLNELFSHDNLGVPFSYFFRKFQTRNSLESTKLSLEDEKKKSKYLNTIYQDSSSRVYELESSLSKSGGLLIASGAQNTEFATQISDLEAKLAKKDDVVAPLPIPLGYNRWKSVALGLGAALLAGTLGMAYHLYNHEGPTNCGDVYSQPANWKGDAKDDGTVRQLVGEYTGLVKQHGRDHTTILNLRNKLAQKVKVAPVKKRTHKRRTRRRAKPKAKPQPKPVVKKGIYRLD